MIAITSISPGHKNFDNQLKAVESWIKAGYKVVSLNAPEEIELLKDFKGVEFVSTNRHNKIMFGKPYVIASALIDYLIEKGEEYNLILNSDIIIKGDSKKIQELSRDGVVIMSRRDFLTSIDQPGAMFTQGFDGFFINKKFLNIFPQTLLCLGQCFWDYWIPYCVAISGTKLYRYDEPYLFHKTHNAQYSHEQWERTGEIFKAEMNLKSFNKVTQLSDYTFKKIQISLQ